MLALSACAPDADLDELGAASGDLIDVDAELRSRFDDAVLFCDRRLLPIALKWGHAGTIGDQALIDYTANGPTTIRSGPHAGMVVQRDRNIATNACEMPVSVQHGQTFSQVQDGFCRADFNYCIGMELALHAQSLSSGGASSPLKAAIVRRARERLQAAAAEYVSSLAFYERVCVSEPGAPLVDYEFECSNRLAGGYRTTAHDRLVSGISQIGALAQIEAGLRADIGDRRLRSTSPTDDPSESIGALYGPEGSRTAAVSVLYGPPDGVAFETRIQYRRRVPVALPTVDPADERAVRALELLRQYGVPLGFLRETPSAGLTLAHEPWLSTLAYQLLDHRMAADRYLPPYEGGSERGALLRSRFPLSTRLYLELGGMPFAPHRSLARTEHRLTEQDVDRALRLAGDVYETQFGAFLLEAQVTSGDSALSALVQASPTPRPIRMLTAAFSGEVEGATSADPLLPMMQPVPRMSPVSADEWYAWNLRRVDGTQTSSVADEVAAPLGAAGALHLLRVHLLRLATLESGFVDRAKVAQAIDLIEHAIGAVWTEHDTSPDLACRCMGEPPLLFCPRRDDQALYSPCKECYCTLERAAAGPVHWDLYYPQELAGAYDGGGPVVVHHVDDVRCLLEERRPGTDAPCPLSTSLAPRPIVAGPITTRVARVRRRYALPTAPDDASHHYVVWRDAQKGHRLIDVVPVANGVGVHPLGGVFLDAAASAWARDAWRPTQPSVSASGAPRDYVPPLESELISDGDDYEDSFARYLLDARHAVAQAREQLVAARTMELRARQNELSDAARLAEAALVEAGELADLCGGTPRCEVARVSLTLEELRIVGPPPPAPDLGPYGSCEEVLAGLFTDFTSTLETGELTDDESARAFVEAHLSRGLGCAMHVYLGELARLSVSGLPVAVRDALFTGRAADFSTFGGGLRERLIALYLALDEVRSHVRRLMTHHAAATILIQAAAQHISYANNDQYERDLCQWRFGLGLVRDIASAGAAVARTWGHFEASDATFGEARRSFADNNPVRGRKLYDVGVSRVGDGMNALEPAMQSGAHVSQRVQGYIASGDCMGQDAAVTAGHRAAQELVTSLATIAALARGAAQGTRATYSGIGELDALMREAQLAGRRRAVARMLSESDSLADLPEWHSWRSFHQRRAEASLRRAERATFVARRAVELRLAVDLTTMTRPEPLTPAPATWADSLFDVGAAVLAVPDDERTVSIAAEELDRYLDRLERFVAGYPIRRRFRDSEDVQVLDLAALLRASRPREDGTAEAELPITEQMIFQCTGYPHPLPAGRLPGVAWAEGMAPCDGLGDVVYGEAHFLIPAELDPYLADRLAAGSFNYRHQLFVPNFVGTGVLDCERAHDPRDCYSDGNVPYVLRHEGPFTIENFDRQLVTFAMEPGIIQGGRALTAERAITTPLSGADRSLITPYMRDELRGRPLAGLYSLRIEGRPELRWAHLERIQILLGYRYWTRQE